ncbi:hypothetical protein B0H11DRAFT_2093399 [Mycena galericulata]|nr:hypothetical protein B0H11DRAFT_2093399 [Mycena galericulata]
MGRTGRKSCGEAKLYAANAAVIPDMLTGPAPPNQDDEARRIRDPVSHYLESTEFSRVQTLEFLRGFQKNPKDFYHIASHVAGKSPRQCVDHYYLLKRNGFDFKALMATAVTGAESALSFTGPLDLPLPIPCLGVAAQFNHMGETAFASAPSPTLVDSSPDKAPTKSSARTGRRRATNTRVASIDADHNVRFQNSCSQYKTPAPIKWSFDEQEEFKAIASQNFRGVLPNLTLPVGSDVLQAFKRIAAQMPRVTTAQVLEFCYWRQNPDGFKDAHTLYEVPPRTILRWADSRDSSALKREIDAVGNEGRSIWLRKRRRMGRE